MEPQASEKIKINKDEVDEMVRFSHFYLTVNVERDN